MNARQRRRLLAKRRSDAQAVRGREVVREYVVDGKTVRLAHVAGPKSPEPRR